MNPIASNIENTRYKSSYKASTNKKLYEKAWILCYDSYEFSAWIKRCRSANTARIKGTKEQSIEEKTKGADFYIEKVLSQKLTRGGQENSWNCIPRSKSWSLGNLNNSITVLVYL